MPRRRPSALRITPTSSHMMSISFSRSSLTLTRSPLAANGLRANSIAAPMTSASASASAVSGSISAAGLSMARGRSAGVAVVVFLFS